MWPVWLYVPNLICYIRAALLALGWFLCVRTQPEAALACFLTSIILDNLDGYTARRFNQTSHFGAFLDVLLDVATRGLLWTLSLPHGLGSIFIILEMAVFVVTHQIAQSESGSGSTDSWKGALAAPEKKEVPTWIKHIMSNNFRTPLGGFVVFGLMGSPLWTWGRCYLPPESLLTHWALGLFCYAGRTLAAAVELWVLQSHLRALMDYDALTAIARQKPPEASETPPLPHAPLEQQDTDSNSGPPRSWSPLRSYPAHPTIRAPKNTPQAPPPSALRSVPSPRTAHLRSSLRIR